MNCVCAWSSDGSFDRFKAWRRIDACAHGRIRCGASVKASIIRKDAGYGGVRIDLQAKLDGARIALQVDIGFGDAVTPGPESVNYPVLLEDLPAPRLRAYPKYTVVAEKFHAICLLGMANTRMKDYFDLWVLLTEGALDPDGLRRAVEATFARRKLAMPTVANGTTMRSSMRLSSSRATFDERIPTPPSRTCS